MSLLQQIQSDAVDGSRDVAGMLRKCKILAARLDHAEFDAWVDSELNGYSDPSPVPDYRVVRVESKGHFFGPFGREVKNLPLSLGGIPKEFHESLSLCRLARGVSELEHLLSEDPSGRIGEYWPTDFLASFGSEFYENLNCVRAWKIIPRQSLVGVLDTIRNRVLSFALKIEAEAPNAGDVPHPSLAVPHERTSQIFQTVIHGDVQNVASGERASIQQHQYFVDEGDRRQLANLFAANGIDEDDVAAFFEAANTDETDPPREDGWGPRVGGWVSGMLKKSAENVWNVSQQKALTVLSSAINSYLGIDG